MADHYDSHLTNIHSRVNSSNNSSLSTRCSLFSLCSDEQYASRVDSGSRIKGAVESEEKWGGIYLAALKSNDYRSPSGSFLLLLLLICLSSLSPKVIIARHVLLRIARECVKPTRIINLSGIVRDKDEDVLGVFRRVFLIVSII